MRPLLSVIGGAVLAFFIFWFMQSLIGPNLGNDMDLKKRYTTIKQVRLSQKLQRNKHLHEKKNNILKTARSPQIPSRLKLKLSVADLPFKGIELPKFSFANELTKMYKPGISVQVVKSSFGGHGTESGDSFFEQELVPHGTVQPEYPEIAAKRKIEGWVKVEFTVNEGGWVKDILVIDSQPRGIFEQATVEAVSNWKYFPVPAPVRATQHIKFTLDQLVFYQGKR